MKMAMALLAGLVFGFGLIISGMTDPSKVIAFLDITGQWDPSLAFVMGGAVMVGMVAFRVAARRKTAVLGDAISIPTKRGIDRRLVIGALVFGIGWGLAGYCPGPALTSLLSGSVKPLIFTVAMLVGMAIFEWRNRKA